MQSVCQPVCSHFRDRKIHLKAYAYGCWQALGSCWILAKGLDLTKWASIRAVHNMVARFPQNEKCKCEKECVEDGSQCLFYILFSEGTYHYFCQVLSSHIEQPNYKVGGVNTIHEYQMIGIIQAHLRGWLPQTHIELSNKNAFPRNSIFFFPIILGYIF